MRPVRRFGPRAHVHRGTVEAVALWFDSALLGEAEARQRVLSAWTPGAGVYALAGGFLLRLPTPRRVASAGAPGLPFTLEDGVLLSAPLSPSERERLAPPPGAAVLVRAGTAEVFPLDSSRRVEVSAWLDVSAWEVVPVEGLGAPPPPVRELPPVVAPTRASFGLGAPAPEAEAMRARMEGRPVPAEAVRPRGLLDRLRSWWRGEPRRPGAATVEAVAPASLFTRLRSWLRGGGGAGQRPLPARTSSSPSLLARLGAWMRGNQGTASPHGATRPASPSRLSRWLSALFGALGSGQDSETAPARAPAAPSAPPPPPPGPGLLEQLADWLARSTPLGPLLGRRKAEYVRRLFDMFDEGNLEDALRYAIPLGKGELTEQAQVALGLPGPREQLAIQPRQGGASSVFGGGPAVFAALQERYRAAFRKLEREGHIEQAAFILAELLNESEEAVSFLERHGKLKLAAELAEGRKLAPGLVVRQWMLAKDVARAVDIARRTGAFADAVPRLERTHAAEARVLRLLWGEVLAEAGDYGRAVEVVWPIEDARRLTLAWLERGVEAGGVGGARLLARMAVTFPERFDAVRARVLTLLDTEDVEGAPARHAFTEALTREVEDRKDAEAGRVLLRPAVRAVLRDRASGSLPVKSKDIERMVLATGDTALRADLPSLPQQRAHVGFPADGTPPWLFFDAAEGGAWSIHDAVPLSGGRLLVALGEAGARLLTPDGRCVAHFDVPAFSLVLSVHGDRVLALAPRGTLMRLSRLDLTRYRAEPWCDARIDAFAPMYDGNWWFIAAGDTVMAVDVLASDLRALWRVSQVGERVLAVAAGPNELSFLTARTGGELERWSYSLPDPTLRARQTLAGGRAVEQVLHFSLWPDGELAMNAIIRRQRPPPEIGFSSVTALLWLGPFSGRPALSHPGESPGLVLGGAWMASVAGDRVQLLDRATGGTRATFSFPNEPLVQVSVRFVNEELLLFDPVGRLVRVDLSRGEVRRVVPR